MSYMFLEGNSSLKLSGYNIFHSKVGDLDYLTRILLKGTEKLSSSVVLNIYPTSTKLVLLQMMNRTIFSPTI